MTAFRRNQLEAGAAKRDMRKHLLALILTAPWGLLVLSCSAANAPQAPTSFGATEGPAPALSPSEYVLPASTQEKGEPKDTKRGNTPPGMDRTGGGPAAGAIVDPEGVVSKPVVREQESPR